jgi:hypothetical protein
MGSRMVLLRPVRTSSCDGVSASAAPAISISALAGAGCRRALRSGSSGQKVPGQGTATRRDASSSFAFPCSVRPLALLLAHREGKEGLVSYGLYEQSRAEVFL